MGAAERLTHPLTRALLVLTFSAGIVDAISFLALGTVFSAVMQSNVLLLGFGIAGEGGIHVLEPLLAMVMFTLGAVGGGLLGHNRGDRAADALPATIAIETALIAATAVYALAVDIDPRTFAAGATIAVLAFAMGLRTATALAIGLPDLSTTVVGLAFAGLGGEAGAESAGTVRRRVATVAALLLGALAGAALLRADLALALFAAAAASAAAGLDYRRAALVERRQAVDALARCARGCGRRSPPSP